MKFAKIKPFINVFLMIYLVIIIVTSVFFSTVTNQLQPHDVQKFNQNWTLIYDGSETVINLPKDVNAKTDEAVTISKALTDAFKMKQTVLIRGSLSNVIVKLDGETIYEKDFEENVFKTYASIFHFIEIPENSDGKTLEITIVSPYKNMTGQLNDIYFGSPSGIRDHLISEYGPKLVLALVWLFTSIVFLITNLIFTYKKQTQYTYISIFGILMSLWLLTESRILQLLINNDFLIGSLSYLSMALAPIAIMAFFKTSIFRKDKYLFNGLIILFMINFVVIVLLHMTQIASFFESAISTQILMVIAIVSTIYRMVRNCIQTKSRDFRNYTILFIFFSLFLALEIMAFLLGDFDSTSVYASIGMLFVYIIVLTFNVINISRRLRESYQQKIYEEIAHTDQLTKAKSRFAFETDGEELFYKSNIKLGLIYFDFDDLKHINDAFGHLIGDEALIKGYQLINDVFKPYGYTYRIGGDEFACLSIDVTIDKYNYLKDLLQKKINQTNEALPYVINISVGYAMKQPDLDQKLSDLVNRADQVMYLDKKNKK